MKIIDILSKIESLLGICSENPTQEELDYWFMKLSPEDQKKMLAIAEKMHNSKVNKIDS